MGLSRSITGVDDRGSSYDRRRRRNFLLSPASGLGGAGDMVPCWECGAMVRYKTLIVDRIIPGEQGGRYTRDNIRPHCCTCSGRQGQRRTAALRRATDPFGEDDLCTGCGVHYTRAHKERCPQMSGVPKEWR